MKNKEERNSSGFAEKSRFDCTPSDVASRGGGGGRTLYRNDFLIPVMATHGHASYVRVTANDRIYVHLYVAGIIPV